MGFLSNFFSNRRAAIVEKHIKAIIASGRTEADASDLYFEAACKYAVDNGGKLYDDMRDSIIFDKIFNGDNYSIFLMRLRSGGGTKITVTKQRSSYERTSQEADEYAVKAFINGVLVIAHKAGVALSFLQKFTDDNEMTVLLWSYAAEMEAQGADLMRQKIGVAELIFSSWNRLNDGQNE
jgi:hypothetical protein